MGTHVTNGSAKAIVVHTGIDTEFGKVSQRLRLRAPETEFERGVRRFEKPRRWDMKFITPFRRADGSG